MSGLTEKEIMQIPKPNKRYEISYGDGLILDVMTSGKKIWRFRTRDKKILIGEYPLVTVKQAKQFRSEMLVEVAKKKISPYSKTFGEVYEEWLAQKKIEQSPVKDGRGLAKKTLYNIEQRSQYLVKPFGNKLIDEITAVELLNIVTQIQQQGKIDLGCRVNQIAGEIFRFGAVRGYNQSDVSALLHGQLVTARPKHYSTLVSPKDVSLFLRDVDTKIQSEVMKLFINLHILFFVRPGELRQAEWLEFDLMENIWRIPKERMKMGRLHVVPLASQSIEYLKQLHKLTGFSRWLFPSPSYKDEPICENAENNAIRRMGQWSIRGHGFRAMAATILRERGFSSEIIEKQLSHEVGSTVERSYNHAEYLEPRRELMQAWADYLDELRGA